LQQNFLWTTLEKQPAVLTDLMSSVSVHLRPLPYHLGPMAARIMGKLGGRNRHFLRDALPNMQVVRRRRRRMRVMMMMMMMMMMMTFFPRAARLRARRRPCCKRTIRTSPS
jgi:hypothetical protein